ncbi:MAG TPA: formate--phosphoribosylaminoimidazolecarboxamide ligase [Candidatus Bathyarchaeia archaeon]|nr:formate--phosphoribosylaminoimidazolecarboxamide ligase [Candidatus Bathyarchaeia archaeon]
MNDKTTYTIATLGSHCSLQVLKGAKDEGFRTLLVCERQRLNLYKRFKFIDEIIVVESFAEILDQTCQQRLRESNSIIIPHGTFIAYLKSEKIERISPPIFGNKWIFRWEADRGLKQRLMEESELSIPRTIRSKHDIEDLCIVKLHGAAGGRGYFLAWDKKSFDEGVEKLIKNNAIECEEELYIQEYVSGVPVYLQFFYSPITKEIELMGIDRRYESDVDGIGRIPSKQQLAVHLEPSYNVIGNIPLVLRESLLCEVYSMGERFVEAASRLAPPGMIGPFCLEGIYDREGKFITFEFSARIVAGTNLYLDGSPYSGLIFDEPMSMGRRVSREIKIADGKDILRQIIT